MLLLFARFVESAALEMSLLDLYHVKSSVLFTRSLSREIFGAIQNSTQQAKFEYLRADRSCKDISALLPSPAKQSTIDIHKALFVSIWGLLNPCSEYSKLHSSYKSSAAQFPRLSSGIHERMLLQASVFSDPSPSIHCP